MKKQIQTVQIQCFVFVTQSTKENDKPKVTKHYKQKEPHYLFGNTVGDCLNDLAHMVKEIEDTPLIECELEK